MSSDKKRTVASTTPRARTSSSTRTHQQGRKHQHEDEDEDTETGQETEDASGSLALELKGNWQGKDCQHVVRRRAEIEETHNNLSSFCFRASTRGGEDVHTRAQNSTISCSSTPPPECSSHTSHTSSPPANLSPTTTSQQKVQQPTTKTRADP